MIIQSKRFFFVSTLHPTNLRQLQFFWYENTPNVQLEYVCGFDTHTHTHTLSYKSYVCTYLHLRRNKKIQDIIYSYRTKVCYLHSFFQFLFLSLCCICVDNCCHLNEPSIRPWNEPSFPVGFSVFLPSDTNVSFCMCMYVYV